MKAFLEALPQTNISKILEFRVTNFGSAGVSRNFVLARYLLY